MQWVMTDAFRQDLKQLVALLTNRPDLQWMNEMIDHYQWNDAEHDEFEPAYPVSDEELIAFRQVEIIGDLLQPEFMLQIDWNEGVDQLEAGIEDLLLSNFGVNRASFPNMRHYDNRTTIADERVLGDFNRELKKQGFNLANIISGDDNVWIIVYPTTAHSQVEQLMSQLGAELA
ncbi:hypothetical protein DES39_1792 [Orbus hercynius]|uniref:DUF6630 domain-containing protein n=1 Tax=Orbus hercynius TaxID=593135 RepID=A0A495RD22_9GAMM|nr:hypothetical protein [Orbus hercynius]RKS85279.1 hypothetical protein DES39_1792 [Orbus hercynius]